MRSTPSYSGWSPTGERTIYKNKFSKPTQTKLGTKGGRHHQTNQPACAHYNHKCIDEWAKKHMHLAQNTIHYHNLKNILTNSELFCLKKFRANRSLSHSHLKSKCYLLRRLAQAYNSLLTEDLKPTDEKWYKYDWTLLVYCLSEPKLKYKLDPNLKLRRTSIPFPIKGITISVELNSNYKTGRWTVNEKVLNRQIYHHFPQNSIILRKRATYKIYKMINKYIHEKTLTKPLRIQWLNEKLLNPQTLLLAGHKKLRELDALNHQIPHAIIKPSEIDSITLFMMNIRSLTKQKLQLIKATMKLSNFTPDISIYTESKYDPTKHISRPNTNIFHSGHEEGQGSTTIITSNSLNIIEADTTISDTVFLTTQKGKATTFIIGTYFHHRYRSRPQRLKLIIEELYLKARKYENPNILIFGDLNMKPNSVEAIIKSSSAAAALKLKISNNYASPNGFPNLTTRVGSNKKNQIIYSQLDYIICNRPCHTRTAFDKILSDHISFSTEIPLEPSKIQKILRFKRKKILREISLLDPPDIDSTLQYIKNNLGCYRTLSQPGNKTYENFHIIIPTNKNKLIQEWKANYQTYAKSVSKLRFSSFQAIAFSALKATTKYDQFFKRDGSIIKNLKTPDGQLINDPDLVSKTLIKHLSSSETTERTDKPSEKNLPTLKPISPMELANITEKISTKKALARFPVPDEFMKLIPEEKAHDFFKDLWSETFINKFPDIFDSKLIPLNKVHPKVPRCEDMRPIVATNAVFKFLELRFSEELQQAFWKLDGYAISQYGFLKHMNTQAQIFNLLNQVTLGWKKEEYSRRYLHTASLHPQLPKYNPPHNFLIFIDFKQAYNSINMKVLYEKMIHDKILEKDKLTFLFEIYSRLRIHLGNYSYKPQNGVPQGGINSPILFNFAIYYFLSDAAERINTSLKVLEALPIKPEAMSPDRNFKWADDLASLLQVHPNRAKLWIRTYFTILIEEGDKWGLHINFSKSAIMEMFTSRSNYNFLSDSTTSWHRNKGCNISLTIYPDGKQLTINIPVTTNYKYLGVKICRNLRGNHQLEYLKAKSNFIINAFTATRLASQDIKFCLNTWQIFVRPLLDYSQTLFCFLSPKDRSKLQTLYR